MFVVVYTTCPSEENARVIAKSMVSQRLVACVNIVPRVQSIYWWEGAVQDEIECLLMMKTTQEHLPQLEASIKALHSYTVPEFMVVKIEKGSADYLNWVAASTQTDFAS